MVSNQLLQKSPLSSNHSFLGSDFYTEQLLSFIEKLLVAEGTLEIILTTYNSYIAFTNLESFKTIKRKPNYEYATNLMFVKLYCVCLP